MKLVPISASVEGSWQRPSAIIERPVLSRRTRLNNRQDAGLALSEAHRPWSIFQQGFLCGFSMAILPATLLATCSMYNAANHGLCSTGCVDGRVES